MMEYVIGFLLGCASSFLVVLFSEKWREALFSILMRIQQGFSSSPINLTGTWHADFVETDNERKPLNTKETISFKHYGSFFEAAGTVGAPYQRRFKYSGKIFHDLVWG
jgi:hypothetical protein